ncbi:MAG: sigma-70 family RNA polymerase sigma factor [Acidimicrobiales bacterium]
MGLELDERVDELWWKYAATRDHQVRDRLIVHYSPLVKFVASRLAAGLPQNVEQADLVSYGIFGLIDAIDRFDPERQQVRDLRHAAHQGGDPRRAAQLRQVRGRCGPRPARSEGADQAGGRVRADPNRDGAGPGARHRDHQLQTMLSQISGVGLIALDEMLTGNGDRNESVALIDTIPDSGDGPVGLFETKEMKQLLALRINGMGEAARKLVLVLYYFEHFTLAEIGKVLGVTESRVYQIHTKAVMQLRVPAAPPRPLTSSDPGRPPCAPACAADHRPGRPT